MAPITRSRALSRKVLQSPVIPSIPSLPSLPTELRLMIWRETFEPRILHITSEITNLHIPRSAYVKTSKNKRIRQICCIRPHTHVRFKAREPPPIALQICRESRALALKYYVASFHPTTDPSRRANETPHTAVYFSPELDIVHIVDQYGSEFDMLTRRTDKETTRRIRALAVGSVVFQPDLRQDTATNLLSFESLETLILVVDGEVGETEELIRKHAEDHLVKVQKDRLELQDNCKAWNSKLPAVKMMNSVTLESHL